MFCCVSYYYLIFVIFFFFFFKQKTAYEMRISDWSSDVCSSDLLGGLYLDILKDRLYTLPKASLARRSAQTALLHIAEGLVRWIAPILSYTADEIWNMLPGDRDRKSTRLNSSH